MLRVYDIDDVYNSTQIHSVVAESIGDAERIYKSKYSGTIKTIRLHAEYVQVQGIDEAPR